MDQALRVFATVAARRSFTRAAEELHMTQPAVTHCVRNLEKEIGARLLDRTNKYVQLTKAGEIVYDHAVEILGLYTQMQRLVDDLMERAAGDIAVGASYTYGEYVLPHIVVELHRTYPDIRPSVTIANSTEIVHMMRTYSLDVGIIEGNMSADGLRIEPLAEDEMLLVMASSHHLAGKDELDAAEFEGETWILREHGSGTREATDRMFEEFGIRPQRTLEFGSTQLIKEAVGAKLGVTFLSSWAVRREVELGTLKAVRVGNKPFKRRFSLVLHDTRYRTRALEVFLELLRSTSLQSH